MTTAKDSKSQLSLSLTTWLLTSFGTTARSSSNLAADRGTHLTFMAYMTKALAVIMREFPALQLQGVDMENKQINYRD
ncbi:hypothetical protein ACW180_04265 [Limosilactobacillus fermentum]